MREMVNIVQTLVPQKLNDVGHSRPLLTYVLNITYVTEMLSKYFQVKKIIVMILWGHIK